jgi:hypothetical protein
VWPWGDHAGGSGDYALTITGVEGHGCCKSGRQECTSRARCDAPSTEVMCLSAWIQPGMRTFLRDRSMVPSTWLHLEAE